MKKLLSVFLLLALTLTACKNTVPSSSQTVAESSKFPEAQAAAQGVGSGEVHMLTSHNDGMYYQFFNQCEIDHTDQIGRTLVYAIDETEETARPACNVPGCSHDSTACPAWSITFSVPFIDEDNELYLLTSVNEPGNYHYALQKINAERTQQTTLVEELPHGFVPADCFATDDENLYWIDGQTSDASHIDQIVYAISKADGTLREIYRWHNLPAGPQGEDRTDTISFYSFVGAANHKLYLCRRDKPSDCYTCTQVTFGVLDLTDNSYTDLTTYRAEYRREYTSPGDISTATYDHNYYPLENCYLADINCKTGEAAVLNMLTGERTLLTDSLPINTQKQETDCSITRFGDGWLLQLSQWDRAGDDNNAISNIPTVYYCTDGAMTELPQKRHCSARGTAPIRLMDVQNGIVLASYDYWTGTVSELDKDGELLTQDLAWELYGTIPLEDLLAGSSNFVPLQFID